MRALAVLAFAATLLGFSFGATQPAAAWDDSHGYGTIYLHHHVYYPGRFRHVYHIYKPSRRYAHAIRHRVGYGERTYAYTGSYWPRYHYRWDW
jgi:hypothetical protein